jgi:hypothetical protein
LGGRGHGFASKEREDEGGGNLLKSEKNPVNLYTSPRKREVFLTEPSKGTLLITAIL